MEVTYMNGAGNDFMVMDARGQELDFGTLAVELCKLTGADGFMAVDVSEVADFRLHFYNSDGSRGEMCGNGSRCICRFAYEHGIAGESMAVQTDAGIVYGRRLTEDRYLVRLNEPGVQEVPGLKWEMREALFEHAKSLRHDPAFPKGANANLYTWLDDTTIRILTFERGVEDYTLACGTGSASTAVALWAQGKLPGGELTVENPGGTLKVTVIGSEGVVRELWLEGPTQVEKIFHL